MNKKYSKWLEKDVYFMSDAQEKYLLKRGFSIEKPEEIKYDDGYVRDIPHKIKKQSNKTIQLKCNHNNGKFYLKFINTNIYSNDLNEISEDIRNLTEIIKVLEKLN